MGNIITWFYDRCVNIWDLMRSFELDFFGFKTSYFDFIFTLLILTIIIGLIKLIIPYWIEIDYVDTGEPHINKKEAKQKANNYRRKVRDFNNFKKSIRK